MQSLPGKEQLVRQRIRPAFCEKAKVSGIIAPIDFIAHDPMAHRFEMNPDLVSPACFRPAPDLREAPEFVFPTLQDFEVGDAWLPFGVDGLPDPNLTRGEFPLPAQAGLNAAIVPVRPAMTNGEVFLGDISSGQAFPENPGRFTGLGHQKASAGLPIQPVDQKNFLVRPGLPQ